VPFAFGYGLFIREFLIMMAIFWLIKLRPHPAAGRPAKGIP